MNDSLLDVIGNILLSQQAFWRCSFVSFGGLNFTDFIPLNGSDDNGGWKDRFWLQRFVYWVMGARESFTVLSSWQ